MGGDFFSIEVIKLKKIFFTDIDGTLLNDKKELTPETRKVIEKISEAGHYMVLASGRPMMSVMEVGDQLGIPDNNLYYIGSNGGIVVEAATGHVIMEKRLELKDVEYIFDVCEKMGVHIHSYTDCAIVSKRQTKELDFYQKVIHMPTLLVEQVSDAFKDMPPLKCVAISIEGRGKLEQLKEVLKPWAEGRINLLFSNDNLLEMFPIQSGKGKALEWLSNHLGIPIENTLAAGDQDNDISMIEAAGMGVAMSNGAEHVKEIADKVTDRSNNEDGLVSILEDFFEV